MNIYIYIYIYIEPHSHHVVVSRLRTSVSSSSRSHGHVNERSRTKNTSSLCWRRINHDWSNILQNFSMEFHNLTSSLYFTVQTAP